MFEWYKKEKPVFTGIARGVGGFGFGKSAGGAIVSLGGVKASGGTIIPAATSGDGYNYHVFLHPNTDNFIASSSLTADILIVAGGGAGGGAYYAGGGGAGGVIYGPNVSLPAVSYTVNVGRGGIKVASAQGGSGVPSVFSGPIGTITAIGGGGGGPVAGLSGGSGGGSGQYSNTTTPATPQPVPGSFIAYGNASTVTTGYGDGGGGAGGGNVAAPGPARGGFGGTGQPFPGFPSVVLAPAIPAPVRPRWSPTVGPAGYFGGGGGGANYYTTQVRPTGGVGGGGLGGGALNRAAFGEYDNGDPGVDFTGGGGGGANYITSSNAPTNINPLNTTPGAGGDGGHGIVIVRYQ